MGSRTATVGFSVPPLDTTDIGSVDLSVCSKRFLRQASLDAQPPNHSSDERVGIHVMITPHLSLFNHGSLSSQQVGAARSFHVKPD